MNLRIGDVITAKRISPQAPCGMYWLEDVEKWQLAAFDFDALFLVVQLHETEFPDEAVATLVSLENGMTLKFKFTAEQFDATCVVFCSGEYQL